MITFVVESDFVHVPPWVQDLETFRRWYYTDDFPETGRICFLSGEVWVDMSRQQIFSHNQVKGEFAFVLTGLAKLSRPGRFFPDGMLLTNDEADLSCQPDGAFVSRQSFRTGRVRLVAGRDEGYLELEGTPDMALEIVSLSSVEKDTVILRDLYWRAGICEYWLVDVRGERLSFDILRHTPKGYAPTRKQGGWIKSVVFNKSFRLSRRNDELGNPEFTLTVR